MCPNNVSNCSQLNLKFLIIIFKKHLLMDWTNHSNKPHSQGAAARLNFHVIPFLVMKSCDVTGVKNIFYKIVNRNFFIIITNNTIQLALKCPLNQFYQTFELKCLFVLLTQDLIFFLNRVWRRTAVNNNQIKFSREKANLMFYFSLVL